MNKRIQEYPREYKSVQEYPKVSKRIQEYPREYKSIQEYPRVSKSMQAMQENTREYCKLQSPHFSGGREMF